MAEKRHGCNISKKVIKRTTVKYILGYCTCFYLTMVSVLSKEILDVKPVFIKSSIFPSSWKMACNSSSQFTPFTSSHIIFRSGLIFRLVYEVLIICIIIYNACFDDLTLKVVSILNCTIGQNGYAVQTSCGESMGECSSTAIKCFACRSLNEL